MNASPLSTLGPTFSLTATLKLCGPLMYANAGLPLNVGATVSIVS